MLVGKRLSIGSLIRAYWLRVFVTWGLTLFETAMLAVLPLLIGLSIDGLLADDAAPFLQLIAAMGALLILAVGRRAYDTRAYGAIRVDFGDALAQRWRGAPVSQVSARLQMSGELVDFLEQEVPIVMAALIQVAVAMFVLYAYDGAFALVAAVATLAVLSVYAVAGKRFFNVNRALNEQAEKQVAALSAGGKGAVWAHLSALRKQNVRLSDTEAIVYGLIFAALMSMLGFNLWYAAAKVGASPGEIFSVVTYSYEFLESAVAFPAALQSLTRIAEITERINGPVELER